jgi:cobalt/nickel transport system permease protein
VSSDQKFVGHPLRSLVWTLALITLALSFTHVFGLVTCIMTSVFYARILCRVSFVALWRSVRAPLVFALVAVLSLLFEIVWDGRWPRIFWGGQAVLVEALHVFLRCAATLLAVMVLTITERTELILAALRKMAVPSFAVEVAHLVYSTLHELQASFSKMETAMNARLGFSSLKNRLRSAGLLASGLWVEALFLARQKQRGLAARGLEHASLSEVVVVPPLVWTEIGAILCAVSIILVLSFWVNGTPL